MDRRNYYFDQTVNQSDLDASFDSAEDAIDRVYPDLGAVGVASGAVGSQNSPTPDLNVLVSAGVVLDQTGQRIAFENQTVAVSIDENGASTAVGTPGNAKYLSLFAQFDRVLSDQRIDGSRETLFYIREESFKINVAQGSEAVSPGRVSLRTDQILLFDILLTHGQTQIMTSDIDVTRREWAASISTTNFSTGAGTLEEATQNLATDYSGHIDSAAVGAHNAGNVSYAGGPNWHDGTTNPATTVEGQLDKVVTDLVANAGADRVGAAAQTVGDVSVTNGSIQDQIGELLTHDNAVFGAATIPRFLVAANYRRTPQIDAAFTAHGFDVVTDQQTIRWMVVGNDGSTSEAWQAVNPFRPWTTAGTFAGTTDRMYDVAFHEAEGLWCAVGRVSTTGGAAIETRSTTTPTWTTRTPQNSTASGDDLRAIVYSPSSDYLVAVGSQGSVERSPEGIVWESVTTPPPSTVNLLGLAVNPSNGTLVAVGSTDGTSIGRIYRSTDDGDTWTQVYDAVSTLTGFSSVAYHPVTQEFVAAGLDDVVFSTSNGSSWTIKNPSNPIIPFNPSGVAVSPDGTIVVNTTTESSHLSFDNGDNWSIFGNTAEELSNNIKFRHVAGSFVFSSNQYLEISLTGGSL